MNEPDHEQQLREMHEQLELARKEREKAVSAMTIAIIIAAILLLWLLAPTPSPY